MKRSKVVQLTCLATLAAGLVACEKQEVQTCVDQNNIVQDEKVCEQVDQQKQAYQNHPPNPIPVWWYYHWIFGGSSRYYRGDRVYGGRMYPTRGFSSIRSSVVINSGAHVSGGIVRGGFGSIGHGMSVGS